MSRECRTFYNKLAKLIADKRDITHSVAINMVRTKLSFALLKTCLRGSRSLNENIFIYKYIQTRYKYILYILYNIYIYKFILQQYIHIVEDDMRISMEVSRIAQN